MRSHGGGESQANHVQRMRATDLRIQTDRPTLMNLIEGDNQRLTKAVSCVLAQRRDGHLILPWTYTRHLLRAFEASIGWTLMTELTQANKAYYSAVEGFITSDPLLLNLRRLPTHQWSQYSSRFGGHVMRNWLICTHFVLVPPWFSILDTSNTHLGLKRLQTSGYPLSTHLTSQAPASTSNVLPTRARASAADTILSSCHYQWCK